MTQAGRTAEQPTPGLDTERTADRPRADGTSVSPEIQSLLVGGLERTYGAGDAWLAPYGTAVGRSLTGATPEEAFPTAPTERGAAERPALVGAFGSGHPETDAALHGTLADPLSQEERAVVNTEAVAAAAEREPAVLLGDSPHVPREHLQAWRDLAALPLPPDVTRRMEAMNNVLLERFQDRLRGRHETAPAPDLWRPLNVASAVGGLVNLDYYAVQVRMPSGADPAVFLNQIRTHLNQFVDTSKSTFEPYPEVNGIDRNAARWASTSPVGSFVTIDIPGNDGTVATINAGPDHWTFATVQSPRDGLHPVSGNRQFGYTDNRDGTITFYTRGVDRITESASAAINWASSAVGGSGAVFDGADALWRSFQQRVAAYVRETGGQAQVLDPVTVRPDWSAVRDVLTGREAVRTFLDRQR